MTTIISEEELKEEMQAEEADTQTEEQQTAEDQDADSVENESEDKTESADDNSEEDEELNVKYMRLMADFQNFKRRADRERSEIYARANENIVTQLLDVADNFERALADDSAEEDENFRKGMEMIYSQLMDVLAKAGVSEIIAEGEDFDPNFHHAVMQDKNDDYESGKVTEVLQKGYTLNGKVIRPSMVKVNE